MDGPVVRRPGRAVPLLLTALLTVSCTGDGSSRDSSRDTPESDPERTTQAAPLDARIGAVAGMLPKPRRRVVLDQVATVVDGWFEAAYLGGDYPRSDFADAFPGFTRGAARLARADRRTMSNAGIGGRVEEVTAERKLVRVDVLSPKKFARAATARFRLVFTTDGRLARRFVVSGRLMLTKDRKGAWRVFAYDVRRSARAGGTR
jgi:hypothetical protein